ncbi:MAG: MATE family efflux transporter, partial [Lachnospiraceae bacterium]|nr:MATE family efflux transporter [Lachnospiraceae bacterium]
MKAAALEEKQLKRREYLLNGNMWKVVLSIALPMVFYNLCNYFYGIYDMMLVQSAGIGDAADIVVLDQIKNMISTIGGALATGGGIMVARRYGAKELTSARLYANTLFSMAMVVALVTLVLIPAGVPFLQLFNTDPTIIENSIGYYNVQIMTLVITTMNSAMISMEKAKGNTKQLLLLNLGVIFIKVSLTTLFVYGPFENVTNTWLAVST